MTKRITPTIRSPSSQQTEHFRRPDHPDFMSSIELRKKKWSGIRKNEMGLTWEFWILGKIEKEVSFQSAATNPNILREAHIELFQMTPEPNLFKR